MKNVLVVDDETLILEMLQRMFGSMGFDVYTANSWTQAAELYRTSFFDLVLLDVVMPGVCGFQAAEEIKRRNPGQKVVLITGLGREMTEGGAQERGVDVDDYLFKPFTFGSVKGMLENVLSLEESVWM